MSRRLERPDEIQGSDRYRLGIDMSKRISFTFDGVEYEGRHGDTLASALLANGVDIVCPSPVLGRPRGVFSAGPEEPCAFVEVLAPELDLIAPATTVELVDGLQAAGRPGTGRLRLDTRAANRAEHRYARFDTVVVGGGNNGANVAWHAASEGDRVLQVNDGPWPRPEISGNEDFMFLPRATALGVYDAGYVLIHERSRPVERLWHVRAGRVVLATGAVERPIAFGDCDRPGVMLAWSATTYVERFGVLPGTRVVIFTTNDSTAVAEEVFAVAGAEVIAVADVRRGDVVVRALGDPRVEAVVLRDGDGGERTVEADLVLVSGGWNPVLDLWRAIGGGVRWDDARSCFIPDGDGPGWLEVFGTAAGDLLPEAAPYWYVPAEDLSTHFVDFQRDQTVADVIQALGAGLRSVEHVKRATYIGTAVDQGRTSGVLTAGIVNALQHASADAQGPSSARPPHAPVSFAVLAGPYRGDLLDPSRTTPMHDWHVEHGAAFEDVGQWKRPWYFPRESEAIDEAVARECLAVRNTVGAMDASTLGKIEVVGPDAPAFLDRMYTNRMSNLPVGSIRYGLMCGLDGMVFDDGVAMRLADDRYLVTTTTGGAARVLDHFEEWLQTEWPDLRVFSTSVTEQWAVVAVNGPRARELLAAVGTDVDLSREAFPHMTFRDGVAAGVPARLARVSFSGELAFEVHVGWWHGSHVWDAVAGAGEPFGLTPYGTETMHVLRAEKGYVIVGQDTDGTVTPYDLGMDWIVNPSKGDFVGRRSFRRADLVRPDRKQLVGLLPVETDELLPEGAQLVEQDTGRVPMPMVGHVTSSYRSAALGRSFALGLVAGGHGRHGETVFAPLVDRTIAATITGPVFYDPEGARRDG